MSDWNELMERASRVWRFGQTENVNVYIITSTADGDVVQNIERMTRACREPSTAYTPSWRRVPTSNERTRE